MLELYRSLVSMQHSPPPCRIKLFSRLIIIHKTELQNKIFCVVCMTYVPANIAEIQYRPTVEVEKFGPWHWFASCLALASFVTAVVRIKAAITHTSFLHVLLWLLCLVSIFLFSSFFLAFFPLPFFGLPFVCIYFVSSAVKRSSSESVWAQFCLSWRWRQHVSPKCR